MSAVQFEAGKYYELRTPDLSFKVGVSGGTFILKRGSCVLCSGFVSIDRKKHVELLFQTEDGETKPLYHRVSRFNRGSGDWREMNSMMVVAMADKLPVL